MSVDFIEECIEMSRDMREREGVRACRGVSQGAVIVRVWSSSMSVVKE